MFTVRLLTPSFSHIIHSSSEWPSPTVGHAGADIAGLRTRRARRGRSGAVLGFRGHEPRRLPGHRRGLHLPPQLPRPPCHPPLAQPPRRRAIPRGHVGHLLIVAVVFLDGVLSHSILSSAFFFVLVFLLAVIVVVVAAVAVADIAVQGDARAVGARLRRPVA